MGGTSVAVDPANVVQALVYTLLDVFDATRDLYITLRAKEKRDYEYDLRSRGYRRKIDHVEDELQGDGEIVLDKAAVKRQFEIGYSDVGAQFAIGDVISQAAVQSQIITLQSVIISTFLYGPTSPRPISHQLSGLLAASRVAGTSTVDLLAAQRSRQAIALRIPLRSTPPSATQGVGGSSLPYPVTDRSSNSTSTALVKSSQREPSYEDSRTYPAKTTILSSSRPTIPRSDTESTSFSGLTSYGNQSTPHTQFCLYALDLQRHTSQPLSSTITSDPSPYCPYCKRTLLLSPGRAWELYKDDDRGRERCFHIQNRFVVKCHREGADGGYSCVLCSRGDKVETVCGEVKALIKHIWTDHGASELEAEEDIIEIKEKIPDRRRDSVLGSSSRRSMSLGPNRSGRRRIEKEVEVLDIRVPRRES